MFLIQLTRNFCILTNDLKFHEENTLVVTEEQNYHRQKKAIFIKISICI